MACDMWVKKLMPDSCREYSEALIDLSKRTKPEVTPLLVGVAARDRRAFQRRLRMEVSQHLQTMALSLWQSSTTEVDCAVDLLFSESAKSGIQLELSISSTNFILEQGVIVVALFDEQSAVPQCRDCFQPTCPNAIFH